jgi:cytochrome oxidase assembly protein ShyY1
MSFSSRKIVFWFAGIFVCLFIISAVAICIGDWQASKKHQEKSEELRKSK